MASPSPPALFIPPCSVPGSHSSPRAAPCRVLSVSPARCLSVCTVRLSSQLPQLAGLSDFCPSSSAGCPACNSLRTPAAAPTPLLSFHHGRARGRRSLLVLLSSTCTLYDPHPTCKLKGKGKGCNFLCFMAVQHLAGWGWAPALSSRPGWMRFGQPGQAGGAPAHGADWVGCKATSNPKHLVLL